MVNLATLLAFWKKRELPAAPPPQTLIQLPGLNLETTRSTSSEAANRAREELKILRLERQILGSALTTIYESQTKGVISQAERDQLLEKYKVDLKRLEKSIDEKQRVVDLFDLESTREELVKNFKAKLAEIDAQVKSLRSGAQPAPREAGQQKEQKPDQTEEARKSRSPDEDEKERTSQKQPGKEKKQADEEEQQISSAEKRIEQIREEILKAMDRLEQIEAEG